MYICMYGWILRCGRSGYAYDVVWCSKAFFLHLGSHKVWDV